MNRRSSQSGSAFFIILIAIAMFAAFSYTVFQGGTKSQSQLTDEQARMAATDIIAYGDTLAKTVQALKLRGCADTQFDFENQQWVHTPSTPSFPAGSNPNAVSGCKIFSATEGAANALVFPVNFFISDVQPNGRVKYGSSTIRVLTMVNIGGASPDLVYEVPFLTLNVCRKINEILNVQNGSDGIFPPKVSIPSVPTYAGSYATSENISDVDGIISGKSSFCADVTLTGNSIVAYRFFRVLVAR